LRRYPSSSSFRGKGEKNSTMRIDIRAFALSVAIVWGVGVMWLGWMAAFGWAKPIVDVLASGYIGYGPSFLGGVIVI
jgi:hypothetical protein